MSSCPLCLYQHSLLGMRYITEAGDRQGLFVKGVYWEISLPGAPISVPCPAASFFRNFSWSWCNIPVWYIRILKSCYDAFRNLEMTLSSLDFVEKYFCLFCCCLAWVKGDFLVTAWPSGHTCEGFPPPSIGCAVGKDKYLCCTWRFREAIAGITMGEVLWLSSGELW